MKILALEHEAPNATADGFQQYAKDEARKVWEARHARKDVGYKKH